MSKIAVFFDAENVSSKNIPQIISFLRKKGDILFQRAYADWSIKSTKSWQKQLSKTPITAIQQFHEKESEQGAKESVDKAIMMDAIEMAIKHEKIDIFTLVASDNGYYALALRLRELGKRVIGIGEKEKCKPIWVNSCNEFSYFEDLEEVDAKILIHSKDSEDQNDADEFKEFSLEKFLEKAFDSTPKCKDGSDAVLHSQFCESILSMKPDFNPRDYGKKTQLDFIKSYGEKFKVFDDGKSPKTYFVEKIETPILEDSGRKTGRVKRKIFGYCIITADDGGDYFFYRGDINPEFKYEDIKRDTNVDFAITKVPNPAAAETKDRNGKAEDVKIISS